MFDIVLYERYQRHWNSIGPGCQAAIIEHIGSYMNARNARSAEHSICYLAPDSAGEEIEDLAAVFK